MKLGDQSRKATSWSKHPTVADWPGTDGNSRPVPTPEQGGTTYEEHPYHLGLSPLAADVQDGQRALDCGLTLGGVSSSEIPRPLSSMDTPPTAEGGTSIMPSWRPRSHRQLLVVVQSAGTVERCTYRGVCGRYEIFHSVDIGRTAILGSTTWVAENLRVLTRDPLCRARTATAVMEGHRQVEVMHSEDRADSISNGSIRPTTRPSEEWLSKSGGQLFCPMD